MCHPEGKLIAYGVRGTLEPAGSAVPAFDRIIDDRLLLTVRPVKNVARADLVAVSAPDASIIDYGWHPFSPLTKLSPPPGYFATKKSVAIVILAFRLSS